MIWSWRTRIALKLAWGPSNSSPWNFNFFFFLLSFLIFPLLSSFSSSFFFPFSFLYFSYLLSFWAKLKFFKIRFWYLSVVFFFLFLFQDPCFLIYQYYNDHLQSGRASEGVETPMFLCVTKSWLSSQINDPAVAIPSYNLFRKDCTFEAGDGVCVSFLKNLFLVLDWTSVISLTVSLCGFI